MGLDKIMERLRECLEKMMEGKVRKRRRWRSRVKEGGKARVTTRRN